MDYNGEADVLFLGKNQDDVSVLFWIAQNCSA
jgi:hypothetical protein